MILTNDQLDALTEVVNIGVGRAAASLCDLVDDSIALQVPQIRMCMPADLRRPAESGEPPLDTSVLQDFDGAISGRALLAFPASSGVALAKLLGEEADPDDELELDLAGILEEVGNIVLNAVLGSLANLFEGEFEYSVPRLAADTPVDQVISGSNAAEPDRTMLMADTHFAVADSEISGSLLLAFSMNQMTSLLDRLIVATEV